MSAPPPLPSRRRALAAAVGLLLLAGCAGAPPTPAAPAAFPLPRSLHVVRTEPGQPAQDAMLVVQREGGALRWSLFDPLGVPLARQILENGVWRNDGFARPNAQARSLFAALVFAWTPVDRLDAAYGAGAWRQDAAPDGGAARMLRGRGAPRWTVRWAPGAPGDTFSISDAGDLTWRVAPLKDQP
ncbi:DUF3261 domain-containing protein [Achromobacter denitrificans]